MKVVHVIPSVASRTGGPAYAVLHMSRALAARGVEAPVLSTDLATPASVGSRSMLVPLHLPPIASECDLRLFPVKRFARLAYAPELGRALDTMSADADIIHIHSLFLYPTYAAFRSARRVGRPYIVCPHGALDPWVRKHGRLRKAVTHVAWQARLFGHASAVQAATLEEAQLWPAYARRPRVEVVPSGIDLAEFDDMPRGSAFRAELGLQPSEPLIVNVGRISEKKGLDVLIRAAASLHRTGIHPHLALVGPDDEGLQGKLTTIAQAEGISGYVHFTGMREGRDKLAALAAADVWALPSHTENFGIAAIEALAARTAIVISDRVNLASAIESAGAGLVTPPNVGATARAIGTLLVQKTLRNRLEERGREFAEAFDWDTVAGRMLEMYEAVLGRGAGRVETPSPVAV